MSVTSSDVRDELGSPSTDTISDTLLTKIIGDEETLLGSASRAAKILYRHFSLKADKTGGRVSIKYSKRANLWKEIATDIEEKANTANGMPIVGGISINDKETISDDSDYPDPFFKRDAWFEGEDS